MTIPNADSAPHEEFGGWGDDDTFDPMDDREAGQTADWLDAIPDGSERGS